MLENAVYSVISPEGCASILWKDAAKAADAAEALKLTAADLYSFGIADKVIPEDGRDYEQISEAVKAEVMSELDRLSQLPAEVLCDNRYKKFRVIGAKN